MKILYVTSEALPFAATGGLGDVLGALPPAVLSRLDEGSDVRVVLPLYPAVKQKFGGELEYVTCGNAHLAWRNIYMGIFRAERHGVTYYFIDNEHYFLRNNCYGDFDDGERFAFFCAAVMELIRMVDFYPDIMHCNDWQTALCPVYLKLWYSAIDGYSRIKTVYTIHNIAYQGQYSHDILWDVFGIWDRDRSILDYDGCINLTKGAIVTADRVSTVSRTYAEEIMSEHYSHGLHHVLRSSYYKLCGIVNGIDTELYDPATDKNLAKNYTSKNLKGKEACRRELCEMCGFPDDGKPIVAMVSRLAGHKGFDLVERVLGEMLEAGDARFVLLGTGERHFEEFFEFMSYKYKDSMHSFFEFNKALASKVYAGADLFLMPSESEPCGLSQMIASRYGTVPIVRETGGLRDTIHSYREDTGEGNGFSFTDYNAHDMMYTVRRAIGFYYDRPFWKTLVKRVMEVDFSWDVSAKEYVDMYEQMRA